MAVPGIMPKSLQICASYFIAQAWSFESVPCAPTLLSLHIEAPQTQRKRNAMHVPPSHCSLNGWNTSRGPERRVQQRHSAILSSTERSFFLPIRRGLFPWRRALGATKLNDNSWLMCRLIQSKRRCNFADFLWALAASTWTLWKTLAQGPCSK